MRLFLLVFGLMAAHAWAQEVTPCPPSCRCLSIKPNNRTAGLSGSRQQYGVKVRCGDSESGQVSSVTELDQSLFPKNVTQLDLSNNLITDVPKGAFGHLPQLQRLDLRDNSIRYLAQEAFSNLTNLRRLDMSGNRLSKLSGLVFLGLERLNSLKMGQNNLTSIAEGTFDDLIALKSLDLSDNPLVCDCHLAWLVDWLGNESVSVTPGSTCLSPPNHKGQNLDNVTGLVCRLPSQVSLEILPDTDQLVFQGDPLRLTCLLVGPSREAQVQWSWRGRTLTDFRPETHFLPHEATTVSSIHIPDLLPLHSGTWRCQWGNLSQALLLTVLTPEARLCHSTVTEDPRGRYSWPATLSGAAAVVPCPALPGARAVRQCLEGGRWGPWDSEPCPYLSNITRALQQFAQLTPLRSKEATEALTRLLRFTGDLSEIRAARDVVYLSRTVTNHLSALDQATAPLILNTVAGAFKLPTDLLVKAELEDTSCSKMVAAVEAVAELSNISLDAVAVEKIIVNIEAFNGLWCAWYEEKSGKRQLECGPDHHALNKEIVATIEIPASLFLHMPKNGRQTAQLIVIAMESAALLPDNTTIKSPVMGCKIIGESLSEPLNSAPIWITAKAPLESIPVMWQDGHWRDTGCAVGRLLGPLVAFHCNSLGYYGLRFEDLPVAPPQLPPLPSRLSPAAAYAACLVLGTCLLVAVVTYVAAPLSMPAATRHSLANTWLAMVLLSVVFSCGVHLTGDWIVCHSVGMLLHYLTMSCLLWMTVTINDLHTRLTAHESVPDDSDDDEPMPSGPKPLLGLYLVGWGVGLIICGISAAVNRYTTPSYCFLPPSSAVSAALVPSIILLLIFGLTWLLAHCAALRRAVEPPTSDSTTSLDEERTPKSQLAAHVAVLLLFLAAWSTAAASVVTPSPYSTVLSCIHVAICTALGTTVLLYFCAGRGDVAAEWKAFADPRQWISPAGDDCRGQAVADLELTTEPITEQTTMTIVEKNEIQNEEPEDQAELLRKIASLRSVVLPPTAASVLSEDTFYDPRQIGVARKFFRRQRLRQNSDAESLFSGGSKVNNTNIHPTKLNNRINLHPNMMNVELSVHKNFFEPPRAQSPMSSVSEARQQKSRYLSRAYSADNLEQEKRRRHRTRRKRRRKQDDLDESDNSKQETCV